MSKFKYTIKEGTVKPKDAPEGLLNSVGEKYGPIDVESDFFSSDLNTYYKTTEKTDVGGVTHDIITLGGFSEPLKMLSQALKSLITLTRTSGGRKDETIREISKQLRDVFNRYRTHLRKFYPDQYKTIQNQLDEISITGGTSSTTPGTGMNYSTPKAFKPKLGYKLVKKKLKNPRLEERRKIFEEEDSMQEFQRKRIEVFSDIEQEINAIQKNLANAKNETIKYYQSHPGSYDVFKPTDLILDYLKDLRTLLE